MGGILGGRYSDRVLSRLKVANGGKGHAEVRKAVSHRRAVIYLPFSFILSSILSPSLHRVRPYVIQTFLPHLG